MTSLFVKKIYRLVPFWLFLAFFKFAASVHYTLMSPLGEQVFPLWLVGLLIGGASLLQLLLDVPSGYLADRFGYRRSLIITTVCFIGAACVLFAGLTPASYVATLFFAVFGWLFYNSSSNAYIMSQSHEHEVGRLVSIKDIFMSIGVVLSGAVILFVVAWRPEMLAIGLVGLFLVALLLIIITPREVNLGKQPREKAGFSFVRESFNAAHRLKPASYLLMISNFTGALFYAIIWFVVPLLIAHNINAATLSLGLGVFDFSIVLLGFFLGTIVDSYNKKLLVLFGMVLFSAAGILLGANFGFVFLLLGFLATTGDELAGLSLWSWLYASGGDRRHYGLVTGMVELWSDLGWTVGPVLAGILYTLIGPSFTISIGGALILVNLVLYLVMLKHPLPQSIASLIAGRRPHRHHHKK